MTDTLRLLSTMPLSAEFVLTAASRRVSIDTAEFIRTVAVTTDRVAQALQEISQKEATVIFTSRNAADAVAGLVNLEMIRWKIYCLQGATAERVRELFRNSSIAATAADAGALAALVSGDRQETVIFFCGDQRRDELPMMLASKGTAVEELVVYTTELQPVTVSETYQGILFYSPSGAKSFFSKNTVSPATVLFAIGHTTAACLETLADNKIITGREPGKEQLALAAIQYFDY